MIVGLAKVSIDYFMVVELKSHQCGNTVIFGRLGQSRMMKEFGRY